MKKHIQKSKIKNQKGITLLALVITIIVLLILAGITISAITGDNGIIGNAGQAKEETEIANEKEIVEKATVQAMGNNKYGNIEESELQDELDKETEEGKTKATDIRDGIEVIFIDSNRYYIVDRDGNVEGEYPINIDKNPGDFTIGEEGETLDGSTDHPYEISCIEDLVVLSNISRGKGNYIENGEIKEAERNTFSEKKFILTQTLNFNSTVSYADLSMTWRYDEEEEAYVIDENSTQNLRDLLMDKKGVGFMPISDSNVLRTQAFAGIFDGQNYEIQNLYENIEDGGGLFNKLNTATIKNLGLTNVDIISGEVGGIAKDSYFTDFYNCYVSGKIKGTQVGGIANTAFAGKIINCYNLSMIESSGRAGGIVAYVDAGGSITIVNSYNKGEIITNGTSVGYHTSSGIIGTAYHSKGTRNIINSCSIGEIISKRLTAGNFYYASGEAIVGLQNCYYLDTIVNEKVIANENSIAFSKGDESVINKLNTYVEAHKNDYIDKGITLYNWKLDANGLPTFEK